MHTRQYTAKQMRKHSLSCSDLDSYYTAVAWSWSGPRCSSACTWCVQWICSCCCCCSILSSLTSCLPVSLLRNLYAYTGALLSAAGLKYGAAVRRISPNYLGTRVLLCDAGGKGSFYSPATGQYSKAMFIIQKSRGPYSSATGQYDIDLHFL